MRLPCWVVPACLLSVACQRLVGIEDGTLIEPAARAGAAGLGGATDPPAAGASGGSRSGGAGAAGQPSGGAGGLGGSASGAGGTTMTGGASGGGDGGASGAANGGSPAGGQAGTAGEAGASGSAGSGGMAGSGAVFPGGAPPIAWVRRYGTVSDDSITLGASDGAHGLIVAGRLTSTMTFAPGFVVPHQGSETRYFLRVDDTGSVAWVRSYTAQTSTFHAMAALPDGGVLVAASIEGTFTPGEDDTALGYTAPPIPPARAPALLRLGADGRLRWARRLDTTLGEGTSVVRTADGVYFAGTYVGSCDLGNGKVLAGQADAPDLFVAKIDETTGATIDGYAFRGGAPVGFPTLVARAVGAAALLPCTKPFQVDGMGSELPCGGLGFVPLAATNAAPTVPDAKTLAIPLASTVRAARAPGGDLYLATRFEGVANVAGASLASGGPNRVLFVRLDDAGEPQAAVGLGGPNTHVINALVPDAVEGVIFAGSARGVTPYEGGSVTATPAGQSNAFLGRLRPSLSIAWLGLAPGAGTVLSQQANLVVSDDLSVYAGASMSSTFFIDAPLTAIGQRDIVLMRLVR